MPAKVITEILDKYATAPKSNMQALEDRLTRGLTKQELEGFFRVTEKLKSNLMGTHASAHEDSAHA